MNKQGENNPKNCDFNYQNEKKTSIAKNVTRKVACQFLGKEYTLHNRTHDRKINLRHNR